MRAEAHPDTQVEWSEPLGHADVLHGLWSAARARRLSHALLFAGPPGIGKFPAARWFALGLFCASGIPEAGGGPCLVCGPCRRMLSGGHRDWMEIDVRQEVAKERSEELRIGRFTPRDEPYWDGPTLEGFMSLRAAEGGWRVVAVREMERANEDSQNSLLKTLEEPPPDALLILECSQPDALLPTIRSRCVRVVFSSLDAPTVASVMQAHGVDAEPAARLARWSGGSPGNALALFANSGPSLRGLLADLLAGSAPAFAIARAVWELEGSFPGKTVKASERERLRFVLDFWLRVLRDTAAVRAGRDARELAHGDFTQQCQGVALLRDPSTARRALETLLALRADIDDNIDPPTLLDRACLALAPRVARRPATKPT